MIIQQAAVSELPADVRYSVAGLEAVLTPALIIYHDLVAGNIRNTVRLLGGDVNRWRPHVKTAKLASIMKLLMQHGVKNFKCATSLELLTLCECGAMDVLLAYPTLGPNAVRVREIASQFPEVAISVLVDDEEQVDAWKGGNVGLFVDINSGMDRSGIAPDPERVRRLVRKIQHARVSFRGLHCYEGHLSALELPERTRRAHRIYDQLLALLDALKGAGVAVLELVTSGTPALPCALSYGGFASCESLCRFSPGTVVYCDSSSMAQLPAHYGYLPAAVVATRVVSRPSATIVTCDAGHKTMSVDRGVPNCVVVGHPEARPILPSEEHLSIEISGGRSLPSLGEVLYLIPKHICPTVNNFDHALISADGRIVEMQRVSARGREAPLRGL